MIKKGKSRKRSVGAVSGSNSKAALFTLGFCYLFVIAEITYKIRVSGEGCTWEIILLFLMLTVFGLFQKLFSKGEIPKDLKGEPLPTGDTKSDKKKRNAFYRFNAFVYSVIFSLALIVAFLSGTFISEISIGSELFANSEIPNFLFGLIIVAVTFPIFYLLSLAIEYVWYEYKISQYNLLTIIKSEKEEKAKSEEAVKDDTKEAVDTDTKEATDTDTEAADDQAYTTI